MIHWCSCELSIEGKIRDFVQKARGYDRSYVGEYPLDPPFLLLSFHSLFPVPEELLTDIQKGYDWERTNWGICWGVAEDCIIDSMDDNSVCYRFDTRDGPPCSLLDKVSVDFPELIFLMKWGNVGTMEGGSGKWINGNRHNFKQHALDPKNVCKKCDSWIHPICHICDPCPW